MSRLVIFAKGNLDVRDSLHSLVVSGKVLWNGVNEIVRSRFRGTTIQVRHETWTRSDALLAAKGDVPIEFSKKNLALGAHPLRSQFSHALFEATADVFVFSLMPDIATLLFRHRIGGHLFYAYDPEAWPAEDQQWLRDEFVEAPPLTAAQSMHNFAQIVDRIRERSAAPILVYNLSAVIPGEWVHSYENLGETFATRIKRFNLALTELSQQTGVSIVDVDRIVAGAGADRVKIDAVHLNADGCRLVAEEVVRILEDVGVLKVAEGAACS
jgi:GDSL-like Lipase/Acylhydrolase family